MLTTHIAHCGDPAMEDDPYYLTTLYPRLPSYALLLDDVPWTFSGRSDANSLPNGPGTLVRF